MSEPAYNEELHQMARAHFNEPMIAFHEVVRCIGYGETSIDCYIIARKPRGDIVWLTCVGGYTFLDRLKGQGYVKAHNGEDWDDLTRLDTSLNYADCPREPEFRFEMCHDDVETTGFADMLRRLGTDA